MNMASRILLALFAVVALASGASAAVSFRHQFQYDLKPEFMNKKAEILNRVAWWCNNAPKDAKPALCQLGQDLGIASKLYTWSGSANPNVDIAGRVEFPTEYALQQWWKFITPNTSYIETKAWVKDAYRILYLSNTCTLPAAGATYYRHSFEYQLKPSTQCSAGASTAVAAAGTANVNNADVQKAVRAWYQFCQDAPARPVTCVFGADLGMSQSLYPSANMAFGGSMDFKSESDLVAFWKYVFANPLYQEINKNNVLASRIQYKATF